MILLFVYLSNLYVAQLSMTLRGLEQPSKMKLQQSQIFKKGFFFLNGKNDTRSKQSKWFLSPLSKVPGEDLIRIMQNHIGP